MKRLISLILSVLLLAGTMCVPVYAEEAADTYPDFQFATALGFIDSETVYPDEEITRIQLAEIFYNIIFYNTEFAEKAEGETENGNFAFSDVPADKQGAVALVSSLGIMNGMPDGTFRPDEPVTFNQLVKTFVAFLGYDFLAQESGGWPNGYMLQANMLGILPKGQIAGDSKATGAAVAQLLKLALSADIIVNFGNGPEIAKDTNYLEHWCKIFVGRGTVTGNYLTNISTDKKSSYFGIYIDNTYMDVAQSADGIQNMLGYELDIYYTDNSGDFEIVYFEDDGLSSVTDIDAEDIISATAKEITYYKDGIKKKKCTLEADASVIYNGSYLSSFTDDDLNPAAASAMTGTLRLIDNDKNGRYDIVVVDAYDVYVVSEVKDMMIFNVYKPGEVINIENYKERNIDITNVYGQPVLPSDIKAGCVVNVCRDKDGNVKSIMVSKDSITGQIQAVEKDGTKISGLKMSEVEFDVLSKATVLDAQNRIGPGVYAAIYLCRNGKIAYIDIDKAFADGYQKGVLAELSTPKGLDTTVEALVFGADGEMHRIKFPDKVEINEVSTSSLQVASKFGTLDNGKVKRQAILYTTDETGETFRSIQIADDSGVYSDGFYLFAKGDGSTPADEYTYSYRGSFRSFDNLFVTDENTVTFAMPSEDDRNDFEKYALSTLSTDESEQNIKADIYGTKKEGMVADIVLIEASLAGGGSPSYNPSFVVANVIETMTDTGEDMYQIEGHYVAGTTYYKGSFLIKRSLLMSTFGEIPDKGDIFRVPTFTSSAEMKLIPSGQYVDVFDYSEKSFFEGGANPSTANSNTYRYGKVIEKSGNVIKVRLYDDSATTEVFLTSANYFKIIEIQTRDDGEVINVKKGDASCIIAENDCPGMGSDVIINTRGAGIAIFVYN